jgi:hypothetical protein
MRKHFAFLAGLFCMFAFHASAQDRPLSAGTLTGPLLGPSINGTVNPAQFAGADMGAKIDTAFTTACTGNSIHIQIPPGAYSFSTPIIFSGSCMPQIDAAGVEMDYTGTGQAITFIGLDDHGRSGGFGVPKYLRGLHLVYAGRHSTSVVGIAVGDTSASAAPVCCGTGIRLENDWIDNFGIDLLFGSNAWNFSAIEDYFSVNHAGKMLVSFPPAAQIAGESIRFTNCTFFSIGAFLTNGINFSNGGVSSSWDGDNFDNVEIELLRGNNNMISPYWENPDAAIPHGHFFLVTGATGALFSPYFLSNKGWAGAAPHYLARVSGSWFVGASSAAVAPAASCTDIYSVTAGSRLILTGPANGCGFFAAENGANVAAFPSDGENSHPLTAGNASGFKHVHADSTCTTATALGSTCTFSVALPGNPYADTNFTTTCTGVGTTGGVPILTVHAATASQLTLQIQAGSATAATIGGADCIAVHD